MAVDAAGIDHHVAAVGIVDHARAEPAEDARGGDHVVQVRDVADLDGFVGQQGRAQDGEHGVLGAGRADFALEGDPAADFDLLHQAGRCSSGVSVRRASAWISLPISAPRVA